MSMASRRQIKTLAEAVGASDFHVVRQKRHLVVDFYTPDGRTARATLSVTASDHRAFQNKVHELRRALRQGDVA